MSQARPEPLLMPDWLIQANAGPGDALDDAISDVAKCSKTRLHRCHILPIRKTSCLVPDSVELIWGVDRRRTARLAKHQKWHGSIMEMDSEVIWQGNEETGRGSILEPGTHVCWNF